MAGEEHQRKNSNPTERSRGKESCVRGLTYLPDLLEISESSFVRQKVTLDFLDFVRSVSDILTILSVLKLKHLRSTKPLPQDVIREIRTKEKTNNRTRFLKFEALLPDLSLGISASVDNLLRPRNSSNLASFTSRGHTAAKKKQQDKPCRRLYIPELNEIVGKKTKPIWHIVAKEKEETIVDHFGKMNRMSAESLISSKASSRKGTREQPTKTVNINITPLRREKRRNSDFSIKFATSDLRTMKQPSLRQQEIMFAYDAGFDNVQCHRAWQDIINPQWFADLVKASIQIGIPSTPAVVKEFNNLSKFFDMNCTSYPMSRAKVCFIVQSLPIWDITRAHTQRAIEFVLSDVLTMHNASGDLSNWLHARRLPYVVEAPKTADPSGPLPSSK